jgi:hypothetical protein
MRKSGAQSPTRRIGRFIESAPVCIAVFCRETKYLLKDGSAATQNILNAARAHSLGSCWVAGDKKAYAARVRSTLGVPADYRLVSLVAIGRPAEEPHPENTRCPEYCDGILSPGKTTAPQSALREDFPAVVRPSRSLAKRRAMSGLSAGICWPPMHCPGAPGWNRRCRALYSYSSHASPYREILPRGGTNVRVSQHFDVAGAPRS